MLSNAVAGAGLGATIAWYEDEDIKKNAMIGAAASVGAGIVANMTRRPKAAHVVGSAIIYTGLRSYMAEGYPEGYPKLFVEGLAVGIGSQVITGFYGNTYGNNDGRSIMDYTRGQAP
jgi:hypothetical protein